MGGCSEDASKIELEVRLAELNCILRQIQGRKGLIYQTVPRAVSRGRRHTRNTIQLRRLPRSQFTFDGQSVVRLRSKWIVRLWLASVGVATVAWLAALAWAATRVVGYALS